MRRRWKPRKCNQFTISERGKTRLIDAPHIVDRQVQKTFTREVLCKSYDDIMLYDNNASRLGKGLHFSYMRTKKKMHDACKKYGPQACVIRLDLKSFFANAPLKLIYKLHSRYILDDTLRQFADYAISNIPHVSPGRGLPLGVELSQQEMLMLTTLVDNYIVCQLKCGLFNRFMDDYIVFVEDEGIAKRILCDIIQRFYIDDIPVNVQKCCVNKITQPFKYCKVKFTLHDNGKITLNGCRDGVKRFKRKIQFMKAKHFNYKQMLQLKECCEAYYKGFNDNKRIVQINKYFSRNTRVLHENIYGAKEV